MKSVIISAPAKINWTLDICGIDEKGYHTLDMLMQRISLFDVVYVTRAQEGIEFSSSEFWLPTDMRNTAVKAADMFFEKVGKERLKKESGAKIYIKKNIPSGAGLAGGSADAAAVLSGLNKLYGYPLLINELSEIALKVGADVPFMLKGVYARAQGIGEILTELTPAIQWLLLVMKKRESASTKEVYSRYDLIGSKNHPDNDAFIKALHKERYMQMKACGGNALTEAACSVAPGIAENAEIMKSSNALFTSMTGSGSVVFGVFKSKSDAQRAVRLFPQKIWSCVCSTIDYGNTVCDLGE